MGLDDSRSATKWAAANIVFEKIRLTPPHSSRVEAMSLDRATLSMTRGGHQFRHLGNRVICLQCRAVITDEQICNAPGTLDEALNALMDALGECTQLNRFKGRLAGPWHVVPDPIDRE